MWLAWFAAAGLLSFWLALHLPGPRPSVRSAVHPAHPIETAAASGPTAAGAPARPVPRTDRGAPPLEATHEGILRAELARALKRLWAFAGLFGMVGAGAVIGSVAESRRWHLALGRPMQRLARAARLPDVVGLAMPAALLSNAAANGMLVSSHTAGDIDRSALIAGGMANSYLAHASHSIRVMYPVIAAVGLPGALYFGGQLAGGFLFVLGVFVWNRRGVERRAGARAANTRAAALSASRTLPENPPPTAPKAAPEVMPKTPDAPRTPPHIPPHIPQEQPLPWREAARRAVVRAATLLFRMACITVPLALGVEWLLKNGAFDFWERLAPAGVARLFPAELMSIVAAQMGGLVQSASLAAHLRAEGLIDNPGILLAMLTASAVGNPFRMMRRNLPSALALFPPSAAFAVALGMQAARLCITLALIALVILCLPLAQAG